LVCALVPSFQGVTQTDIITFSTTSGCSTRTGSTSPSPSSPRHATCWSSSPCHH
jgi:hypothetical protein